MSEKRTTSSEMQRIRKEIKAISEVSFSRGDTETSSLLGAAIEIVRRAELYVNIPPRGSFMRKDQIQKEIDNISELEKRIKDRMEYCKTKMDQCKAEKDYDGERFWEKGYLELKFILKPFEQKEAET